MPSNLELLQQIHGEAVSSKVPISDLLRRCKVLAVRAQIPDLALWIDRELHGYASDAELPGYRIVHGVARGHFRGPFGSALRNAILPANALPQELRHWATKAYLRSPIAALEESAAQKDSVKRRPSARSV
ncbi:MAG: AbiTii domain-containing protein [Gemmatimonadaceae bacterium]